MCDRFAANGAPISKVYHCPYHPEGGIGEYRQDHPWRKPKPGMILQAASDLDIDLPGSVMIGDKLIDMQCAAAAGIETRILVEANSVPGGGEVPTHDVVGDLAQALTLLRVHCAAKRPL
jgi:D-glycero-D-manno-heptose 1,7-bisphosphate phosphatase